MNAKRRAAIQRIIDKIEELRSDIEALRDEEQEAFDNLPESLQYSEKGERMEEAVSQLEYSDNSFQEVIDYLTEAIEQ